MQKLHKQTDSMRLRSFDPKNIICRHARHGYFIALLALRSFDLRNNLFLRSGANLAIRFNGSATFRSQK